MEVRIFTAGVCVLIISLLLPGAEAVCSDYTRCDECITQDPTCAWCNDLRVLMAFARNGSSASPAQLCGTVAELAALECGNVTNPTSVVETKNSPPADSNFHISQTSATVTMRPGHPANINLTISPPASSAVDMYLLMDLSLTMLQNLNMLRSLAGDLVMSMRALSSDFRIGFGSFIDKPLPPYADSKFNKEFPCAVDAELLGITNSSCEAVYSFRHVLDFTSDEGMLEEVLNSTKLSASLDHPESILDAMLQSALCEAELGWRPKGQSQRIIVAFTDGDYHYALDGKIGGILAPPSGVECRLDPDTQEYSTSHLYDYPSSNLISSVLNTNFITPIFAVPSQVRDVYDGLVGSIRSATVETLSADASSIITLIEEQYAILSGTVVPVLTYEDYGEDLTITVLPTDGCAPGNLRDNTDDVCVGITPTNGVTYTVQVSATPNACMLTQPIQAEVQFIQFGTVTIDISLQCGCNCAQSIVSNSTVCNNIGSLECSTCVCNEESGTSGAVCECPLGVDSLGCSDPQDPEGRVCNGQGTCQCGQCQCDAIAEGSPLVFQGDYCAFNPQNCPLGQDTSGEFQPCAGNGECNSVSSCVCLEGFTGGTCECTQDTSTCVAPGAATSLCSGEGQCVCGQCVCNDYSSYFGEYCEECLPCRTSCSKVSPCVLCHVMMGAEDCPENVALSCQETLRVNSTLDLSSTEGMKLCSLREGSCEVRYYLGSDVRGDENMIQIFLDSTQDSLVTLGEGSNQCNPPTPIWPIFVGIILGTIVVGILVIVLWRCGTYLGEYLEFQQWSKSIKNDTERSGENPLFVDPSAEYSNPRYRPVAMQ